jgi:hypothetical protein
MADSAAFEAASACLESASSLTRLEARGTIRLALKQAGFEARSVTAAALGAVVRRVLPAELRSRAIADPEAICTKIALTLERMGSEPVAETPEAVFRRLGGA